MTSKLSQDLIKSKNWLIDGANGSEIIKYTDASTADFGAMTTITCPDAVRKVHESYLEAGANFIITNTYSVNYNVLGSESVNQKNKCEKLIVDAVKLAREAIKNCGNKNTFILGSISEHSPYSKKSEGKTYTIPDWPKSPLEEIENFEKTLEILIKQDIDGVIVELLSTEEHGTRLLKCVNKVLKSSSKKLPVFLGLVPEFKNDEKLAKAEGRSLEHIKSEKNPDIRFKNPPAFFLNRDFKEFDFNSENILKFINCVADVEIAAIMLKHCDFDVVLPAAKILKTVWDGPIGTYPQTGFWRHPEWITEDPDYDLIRIQLRSWLKEGLSMFGGCCGTTPELIKFYKKELNIISKERENKIENRMQA